MINNNIKYEKINTVVYKIFKDSILFQKILKLNNSLIDFIFIMKLC